MAGLIQNGSCGAGSFFVNLKRFAGFEKERFYFSASNDAGGGGIVPPHI
jgi:hypothetical protein